MSDELEPDLIRTTVDDLEATQRRALADALTPRFPPGKRYVPHVPHPPQQAFLLLSWLSEVFYGGAAGGGKSDAVLMAALQYVDVPGYSALILRETYEDLFLPGAIADRAGDWLQGNARKRDGGKLWEFATGGRPATLRFGYAQHPDDVKRYQGAEFQFIGIDELTHFPESSYRYMFSRLRGPALPCLHCGHMTSQPAGKPLEHDEGHELQDCPCLAPVANREARDELDQPIMTPAADGTTLADVPLRMRSASNPGGVGHEWVRSRFVDPKTKDPKAVFVPAKLADNPSLDRKAYREGLGQMTEVERRRLEDGDWDVTDDGDVFERAWFPVVDGYPADARVLRYWDLAATVPKTGKKRTDPDWTVGTLMALKDGIIYIVDVVRFRKTPHDTDLDLAQTAAIDGRRVPVRVEQEPGASGVRVIAALRTDVFAGYDFDGNRPTLSKEERARPLARQAQAGNVRIVRGAWNRLWLDEVSGFPNLPHDDQVDSATGAYEKLANAYGARLLA